MTSHNIYEYNKIKPIDFKEFMKVIEPYDYDNVCKNSFSQVVIWGLVNKIN